MKQPSAYTQYTQCRCITMHGLLWVIDCHWVHLGREREMQRHLAEVSVRKVKNSHRNLWFSAALATIFSRCMKAGAKLIEKPITSAPRSSPVNVPNSIFPGLTGDAHNLGPSGPTSGRNAVFHEVGKANRRKQQSRKGAKAQKEIRYQPIGMGLRLTHETGHYLRQQTLMDCQLVPLLELGA